MRFMLSAASLGRLAGLAAAAVLVAAVVAVAVPGSARADLVVTLERKSMRTDPPAVESQQMSMAGDKLAATVQESGRPSQLIWRGDKQTLYSIDPATKSYYAIDKATMTAVAEQVSGAMKQMQDELAKLPPEQRAQAEKMMANMGGKGGAASGPSIEVKVSGEKQTIQGYPCTRYDVLLGGKRTSEMWVAGWSAIKVTKDDMAALRSMSTFFEDMVKSNPMLRNLATSGAFQGLDRVDGFPVLVRHFDGDKVVEEMTLKGVERRAVPAGTFDIPAGYARKELGAKP